MRIRGCLVPSLFAAAAVVAAACGDASRECRVGADCASGMCSADGTCAPAAAPSPGSSGGDGAPGAAADGGPSSEAGTLPSGDAALPGCTPNKDGTITRDEVPIQAGLHATYRIAQNVEVSTAGTPRNDGTRLWDYSGALANDANVIVEAQALAGKWYEPDYKGASYATTLSVSSNLVGVFEAAPGSIALRGVASPDDGFSRTELTYDPPVSVLAFPLTASAKFTTDASVSGVASGVAAAYDEKYESEVDARGDLKTPLGTFSVLRVRTLLTRTVGFSVTTVRSFAFVTECYGTVATVTSDDNEGDVEFTHAAEIRRIAP